MLQNGPNWPGLEPDSTKALQGLTGTRGALRYNAGGNAAFRRTLRFQSLAFKLSVTTLLSFVVVNEAPPSHGPPFRTSSETPR